jgi:hypothetical protein
VPVTVGKEVPSGTGILTFGHGFRSEGVPPVPKIRAFLEERSGRATVPGICERVVEHPHIRITWR